MEEPHQNPNKVRKKCSFFMGIFTWLEPGLKNRWADASIALHGKVGMGDHIQTDFSGTVWLHKKQ